MIDILEPFVYKVSQPMRDSCLYDYILNGLIKEKAAKIVGI